MNDIRIILANSERLEAVASLDDQIPVQTQEIANYLENRLFILDQKDSVQ